MKPAIVSRRCLRISFASLALAIAAWGALALWYQASSPWRWPLLVAWTVVGLATVAAPWLRCRRNVYPLAGIALLTLLGWWSLLAPSHGRDWADDVARLLMVETDGDRIVLRNVRNFDWRSETDYDVRWESREYDLDELVSGDLILSYWMGPAIAHTLVSFGFSDGRQLVFSLEIRKERHEAFSAVAGFFRQYEAVLIAADEHDIVRVRTNVRGEDVRLYRLMLDREQLRAALLGYLQEADEIGRAPRFYNTLTSNCTTIVFDLARRFAPALPLDYRLLLSGYFAEYVYDQSGLVPGYDYPTLEARGDITARARAFDGPAGQFPSAIRRGVPGVPVGSAERP